MPVPDQTAEDVSMAVRAIERVADFPERFDGRDLAGMHWNPFQKEEAKSKPVARCVCLRITPAIR